MRGDPTHVYELDVVEVAVCDGLVHLLILAYPIPEVLQGLHSEQKALMWLCQPPNTMTPQSLYIQRWLASIAIIAG